MALFGGIGESLAIPGLDMLAIQVAAKHRRALVLMSCERA